MSKIHGYRIQVCVKPTLFPLLTAQMLALTAHMIALPSCTHGVVYGLYASL
jgi:hypothetical protein